MKLLIAAFIGIIFISGCSSSRRGIAPTCSPQIGMTEERFLDCACNCPLLSPTCDQGLINSTISAYGTRKMYYCNRFDGNITASFNNGKLEFIWLSQISRGNPYI